MTTKPRLGTVVYWFVEDDAPMGAEYFAAFKEARREAQSRADYDGTSITIRRSTVAKLRRRDLIVALLNGVGWAGTSDDYHTVKPRKRKTADEKTV